MTKYCIALVPDFFWNNFEVKFIRAVEWSPVNLRLEAWLTIHEDEALTIEGEDEAKFLQHELQLRYPLQDFIAMGMKDRDIYGNLLRCSRHI